MARRIPVLPRLGTLQQVVHRRLFVTRTLSAHAPVPLPTLLQLLTPPLQSLVILVGMKDQFLHELVVILQGQHVLPQFLALPLHHLPPFLTLLILPRQQIVVTPQLLLLLVQFNQHIKNLIVCRLLLPMLTPYLTYLTL